MPQRITAPANNEQEIRRQVEAALDTLRAQHGQMQQIIDGSASNIAAVNTALDTMAANIQTLQRMLGKLIRLEVRKLDAVE